MSHNFKLSLKRAQCLDDTSEISKDEIMLLGFGMSREGHRFTIGRQNLGSFKKGNVIEHDKQLAAHELSDNGLDLIFFFWLYEEDTAPSQASLEAIRDQFYESFDTTVTSLRSFNYPEPSIAFQAFGESLLVADRLIRISPRGSYYSWGTNKVIEQKIIRIKKADDPGIFYSYDPVVLFEGGGASYAVTFAVEYERIPVFL